jgi:urea transport system permease protein
MSTRLASRTTSPLTRLVPRVDNPWIARGIFVAFAALIWFVPNLVDGPAEVRKWAEYLCYAILAVGLDIAWGYGGMLVLGQGVFFGLGAYAMGMYLTLENVPEGSALPSFMSLYGDQTSLPALWKPFTHLWFAILAAVLVPALVAAALGALVFTRRVRGPFFALLTQATALVFSLILIGNLPLTAGFNGLTGFNTIFGRSKYEPDTNRWLYQITAVGLLVVAALALKLVHSRFGRLLVATRDSEARVRFLGYNPALVKTVAFAVSAAIAGIAGAFAAPVIGIVSPNQFTVLPSILFVCWVAVGGRGTVWGAIIGALVVNWTRSTVSEARPDDWSYLQGLLFVVVLAFAPGGIVGIARAVAERGRGVLRRHSAAAVSTTDDSVPAMATVGSS